MLQNISLLVSLAIVGVFAGPATSRLHNNTVGTAHDGGWNELLHSDGLFDSNLNSNKLKSAGDSGPAGLLGQLDDLLSKEDVLKKLYSKYRVAYKTSHDPAPSPASVQVFKQKLLDIAAHNLEANSGKHSWWMGVNQFTDLTHLELQKELNKGNASNLRIVNTNTSASMYVLSSSSGQVAGSSSFSWLDQLKVTPARDVRSGPSPAMFAAVSAIETVYTLRTGGQGVISFSEQNILDCFEEFCANPGQRCSSEIDGIFKYVGFNCLASLGQYPYNDPAGKGACRNVQPIVCLNVQSPYKLYSGSSDAQLQKLVSSYGPVVVNIHVSENLMNTYNHGVYPGTECGSNPPNRMVTLIGYGNDGQGDYWLIKNSWGQKWGIQGFLKLARNGSNVCGIQTSAYVVNIRL